MAERGQPENQGTLEQQNRDYQSLETPRSNEGARSDSEVNAGRKTANRGFAAMDREKQKRIASEGGRAAHRQGVAHEWSRDEAKQAGRKGGQMVSRNREHMSEIGRKGGQSSGQRRQRSNPERGE